MGNGATERLNQTHPRVVPLRALERELGGGLDNVRLAQIDSIFFASSKTQTFASPEAREVFREKWLGRLLTSYRNDFFVALGPEDQIIGYLAGCLDDPAQLPLFADIGYFAELSDLTRQYPAHLHINVDTDWRNRGIGSLLIEAFCTHARTAGSPGVHVVTGAPSRNVGFYQRSGFCQLRSLTWNGAEIVCLGRVLARAA